MLLIGSPNAEPFLEAGWRSLQAGGRALDVVEQVARKVEDDREEHSVGTGGYPNLLGQVELDAAIMEGATRAAGAVAALEGYPNAICVARAVMEKLPHVLLVGKGAATFAREAGFQAQNLLTPEADAEWRSRLAERVALHERDDLLRGRGLIRHALLAADPERTHGTVNVIAMDGGEDLAVAVSTSGWAWKYPGRVGDSPIVGAGLYCDNRYGAAACTGHGERTIRGATARSAVQYMESGMTAEEAGTRAIENLPPVASPDQSVVVLIVVDRTGGHCCVSNSPRAWNYVYRGAGDEGPQKGRTRLVRPDRG